MKNVLIRTISLLLSITIMSTMFPISSFANNESNLSIENNDASLKATNAIGELIVDLAETDDVAENSDYYVTDLYISRGYANVELYSKYESRLVVAVYDSVDFNLVGSGIKDIATGAKSAKVKIECDNWPEYYYIKAFLLSKEDNSALCNEHNCFYYTKEYQEFLSKTVDDFDEEEVINLDNDTTNNFIVLSDGAMTVEATEKNNILVSMDAENGVYVIDNPDSELKSLKKDKILYYIFGDEEDESVIICVNDIKQKGSRVTIYARNVAVEDMIQYARIEKHVTTSEDDYVSPEDFVPYSQPTIKNSKIKVDLANIPEFTVGPSFTIPIGDEDEVLHGEVKLKTEVTIKLHFSLDLTMKFIIPNVDAYIDSKIAIKFEATFDIMAEGKCEGESGALPNIQIPVFPGVNVEGDPKFVYGISAKIAIKFTAMKEIGGTYKTGEGSKKIDDGEGVFEPNFESEIEVKIGLSVNISLELLEVLELGGEVEVGLKASAKPFSYEMSVDVKHLCPFCLSGDAAFYYTSELKATFGVDKILGFNINWVFDLIKIDLYGGEVPIVEYYVTNITGSMVWHINEGDCPHTAYKVFFTVIDSSNKPISGATVDALTTDFAGKVSEFYENDNTYQVTVSADGYQSKKYSFNVDGKSIKINIVLLRENEIEEPDEPGDYPGGQIGDITWEFVPSTKELIISGTGNMENYASFTESPWKDHRNEIKSIIVEEGITSIGDYVFVQCPKVTSILLPSSLEQIGTMAFYNCSAIQTITIGNNVKDIGDYAFYNCLLSKDIIIGNSVKTIGNYAFGQCQSVSKITLPKSVEKIGTGAFRGCASLSFIEIQNNNCNIADDATTIPDSVEIRGSAGSTAEKYANKYGRAFVSVSPAIYSRSHRPIMIEKNIRKTYLSKYDAKASNAVVGEKYVLLVLKSSSDLNKFTNDDLLYIDQKTAVSDGNIEFTYVPRTNDSAIVYIIGLFSDSNSVEQKQVTPINLDEPEYNYTFTIQTPSRTTIRHKDGIKLHAKVEGNAPTGSYVVWTASNGKFKTAEINNGNSLKIVSDTNGKTIFTATLYSVDGEFLATDTIEMQSKAGFFDKIGGFFRSLFGATKIYEN